jgi:tetratricopeptide (TPR) repeat protein
MKQTGALLLFSSLPVAACSTGPQAAREKQSSRELAAPVEPSERIGEPVDLARQAHEAWANRADRASLEKAIGLWEQLAAQGSPNVELMTRLSRAYFLIGDAHYRLADETEAMLASFEKGVEAGERAIMAASPELAARVEGGDGVEESVALIPSNGQPAVYWYAANLARLAVAKGVSTTLFYRDRIYAFMQRVLAIDETYFQAGPHRCLGAFYAASPAFAGGDLDKSKMHFERAIELAPDYLGTKVLFAEYYAPKRGERALFTELLRDVVSADPSVIAGLEPEQKLEQEKARRLLSEADEIF